MHPFSVGDVLCCGSACAEKVGTVQAIEVKAADSADYPRCRQPKVGGLLTYLVAEDLPPQGVPLREADLWWLHPSCGGQRTHCALFVNALTIAPDPDGPETTVLLSPFSAVRTCRFESGAYSHLRIFKVSSHGGRCHFLGVQDGAESDIDEAGAERSRWALEVSHVIRLVTQSLFPIFEIAFDPVPGKPSTARRILAGYLVHRDDSLTISVPYCELHAHLQGSSQVILYEDEDAEIPIMTIEVTGGTVSHALPGLNGTSFCLAGHTFASRTVAEQRLWLRAISNIKVKLRHSVGDPGPEDIMHFRNAIREKVEESKAANQGIVICAPLLPKAPKSLLGTYRDVGTPPPFDTEAGSPDQNAENGVNVDAAEPADEMSQMQALNLSGEKPQDLLTGSRQNSQEGTTEEGKNLAKDQPKELQDHESAKDGAPPPTGQTPPQAEPSWLYHELKSVDSSPMPSPRSVASSSMTADCEMTDGEGGGAPISYPSQMAMPSGGWSWQEGCMEGAGKKPNEKSDANIVGKEDQRSARELVSQPPPAG